MGMFDGLPISPDKSYLREELATIDESWTAARFDSLSNVVHILTSKDREGEFQKLKDQSDVIEEVVDEVVHAYHGGFNKAIQNYSQILRLFSESTESISVLKVDLAESKKRLGTRNKQLHQLWYRSVTLRHIISLLDQVENIAKVPGRIEKLTAEKQFYAAVQLHIQSVLMLEREGLQTVGALQDVRSELTKLRGVLFFKVLEDLHLHLYNKGEYSSIASNMDERDDDVLTTTAIALLTSNSQPVSRRTRLLKNDSRVGGQGIVDGSYRLGSLDGGSSIDGYDDDGSLDEGTKDGNHISGRVNGGDNPGEMKYLARQTPSWLSQASPDEFLETIIKSDAPLHVKYLQTIVECLCMLGKVAAAGAVICQRLRPSVHDIITSKIKAHVALISSSRHSVGLTAGNKEVKLGQYNVPKPKLQNGKSLCGTLLAVSPVSAVMAPTGKAQTAAKELLDSILDALVRIFENHVVVGELLETKSTQQVDINTPKSAAVDVPWNHDSDASHVTGGYSVGFSLTILQSECQQLICEVLRATPEAASADAAVQTARLASKAPSKEKRDGADDGLTFAFRFMDSTMSVPNQGVDLIRQGWNKKGSNMLQEGYGTAAVLPEQGIYLTASLYRPVLLFTDKVASMLPNKYSQLRKNDGLLAFVENFVKDHFLPTMFVDYRKGVQQAISSPAAFRTRAPAASVYSPSIEKGRPVLQGLLAIDFLAREVLGWAQAMPKFAGELFKYVQTFLERAYERCRALYMEAVLEKQSYMLIGRHDIEKLMQVDPANGFLPSSIGQLNMESNVSDAEMVEIELELTEILWSLRPIKQENLIRDDNKLILLASLSDSLEYVAESIERLGQTTLGSATRGQDDARNNKSHVRTNSAPDRDLASFAEDYRKLAIDCLKVLRVEMQLETIFHIQEMNGREYVDDQDAEEPDDFVISLSAQITRRDELMAPFVAGSKRNYIYGGICSLAANASIKAADNTVFSQSLADMKSINLFGVQQICRNSIALEQALSAIPSIDRESVQQRLDRVRTYYELLNMPYEALVAFTTEHEHLFAPVEYANLLKVNVSGREIPLDAQDQVSSVLSR